MDIVIRKDGKDIQSYTTESYILLYWKDGKVVGTAEISPSNLLPLIDGLIKKS